MYEQQNASHFIGRVEEVKTFTEWLNDPTAPWILYIHDAAEETDKKGGVGKTSLIRQYANLARQETQQEVGVVMVDFFNIGDRDRIFLAEKIVAGIRALYPTWTPTAFIEAIQQHRTGGSELGLVAGSSEGSDLRIREVAAVALAEDLRLLDTQLAQKQKTLLIFFDTFETIERNTGLAVLRQSQTFPDNYQFENMRVVLAGRNKLDWTHPNWKGREQEVRVLPLNPFNRQEMLEYVETESIYAVSPESAQANALYERTGGRPILIGLTIDVLNHRIITLQNLVAASKTDFEGYLVPQVNNLENPLNWVILFMAHVYHHFNMSVLEWILRSVPIIEPVQSISREELAKQLPQLSFVRRPGSGDDFVLHDEMRRLVKKYCWEVQDTDQRVRREISRSIISYYQQEMSRTQNEQKRQGYIVGTLYHRMFVDLDDGLKYLQQERLNAIRLSKEALARLLLQEALSFSDVLSFAQLNLLQYSETTILRAEERPAAALSILQQLKREADPVWFAEYQPSILIEEGRAYSKQSKLPEATSSYLQALSIEQERGHEGPSAQLLSSLGRLYQRRGQFSVALDYYEKSIAIYKRLGRQRDYATTLMSVGFVYRNQGKTEEALRRCKVAWRILLELFQEGTISELLIGNNIRILGQIYMDKGNIVEAEQNFHQAFDIYLRLNFKGGISLLYNRFGQVQLLKGDLEGAREWFVKAEEASRDIATEQYIDNLNKLGRICALQNKWKEAAVFFEQAIPIAQSVPDYYQQTENLIDLADTLEHLEQSARSQQLLQQAEEIATRENYQFLLGSIEHTRAETDYRAEDYQAAFQHFALYCHHMAQYNSSEFKIAVQKVVDALLGVPKDATPVIVQELLTYWIEHQLDKTYPDLILAFEEVDTLMKL